MDGETVALVISGLALLVSIVGTVLADRRSRASERLAIEARDEARAARADALWSAYIESIQGVMSLDPLAEPVGEAWKRLRVTATALVDGLSGWDGLDRWLAAEHALGVTFGRQVMETAQPGDSADERLTKMKPAIDWAMGLLNNARLFRSRGYDPDAMRSLTKHAHDVAVSIHQRHGWDLPEPPSWQALN